MFESLFCTSAYIKGGGEDRNAIICDNVDLYISLLYMYMFWKQFNYIKILNMLKNMFGRRFNFKYGNLSTQSTKINYM